MAGVAAELIPTAHASILPVSAEGSPDGPSRSARKRLRMPLITAADARILRKDVTAPLPPLLHECSGQAGRVLDNGAS
jgi:hypothetical protein